MVSKIELGFLSLLCGCAFPLSAFASSRPAQTGFYCIDIPANSSTSAAQFVEAVARQLKFEVSSAQYPAENGPPQREWEIYGGGVSMFLNTAMKSGEPDRYDNRPMTFNQHRLGFNVVQTGLRQTTNLKQFVATAKSFAERFGWLFSAGKPDVGCST